MPKPLFTGILHAAVIVRDLDAAVRTYYDEYGIGPWSIFEFNGDTVVGMSRDDKPADLSWRLALASIGDSVLELIQPLDDRSTYAEFLATHGEGVQHIALQPADYGEAEAELRRKGLRQVQGGAYKGVRFDYFSTQDDLGFITELLVMPSDPLTPDSVYPPEAAAG
jgi:hypothetical protein